jgi:O-antigen ligase
MVVMAMLYYVFKSFFDLKINVRLIKHPVTIAILLYLIWVFITSVTSTMPIVSFKFLATKIWFIVVFYLILTYVFIEYKNFYKYLWCYVLSLITVIGYSVYRLSKFGIIHAVRVANWVQEPFFPDHTSYAAALAMLIPVLVAVFFIFRRASFLNKIFYISIIIIYLFGLIFSYTRAAWISLIVACIFLGTSLLKIRLLTSFIIIGAVSVLLTVYWTDIEMALSKNRQESSSSILKHVKSVSNVSTDASNLERINRWHSALKMFYEKPFFGYGPGTYMFKYAPYQATKDRTIISTNFGNKGNAHSEYLGPLAESGLFGLITFLGVVLATLFTASRVYFTAKRRKVKYLALALMIGLFSYDIHGIMNDFLDIDKLNALFWGFTAMVVAMDLYHNKQPTKVGQE